MDLVTLVTACALGADPKLMQALIWQQSGGNPWAISVPGEPSPRIYTTVDEAVSAARTLPHLSGIVRVGLAGLPVPAARVTRAVFLPCWNVTIATQRIAGLVQRCASRPQATAIFCALSAHGGSWQQPDVKFAAEVIKYLISKQVPDFDMPKGTSSSLLDIATHTVAPLSDADSVSASAPAEREHAWLSALFPLNQKPAGSNSKAPPNTQQPTADKHAVGKPNASSSTVPSLTDGPFMNGSKNGKPQ